MDSKKMYSIGEISKIVNISTDAMRYYDEIDLLKPCFIEQSSRYRYYSEEQVNELLSIMELKQYRLSLEEIKDLIKCKDNAHLQICLLAQLDKLVKERTEISTSINLLEKRIMEIKRIGENNMDAITVLIVDDSDFMRLMLKDILTRHNYKVIGEAINGKEAVDMYMEHKPSVTIMDIHMAEAKDGITALEQIRVKDNNANIIMLTAINSIPIILECINKGASYFITKPFAVDTLCYVIKNNLDYRNVYNNDKILTFLNNLEITPYSNTAISQNNIDELLSLCATNGDLTDTQAIEFINKCIMA